MNTLTVFAFGVLCALLEVTLLNFPNQRISICLMIILVWFLHKPNQKLAIFTFISALFLDLFSNLIFGFHLVYFGIVYLLLTRQLGNYDLIKAPILILGIFYIILLTFNLLTIFLEGGSLDPNHLLYNGFLAGIGLLILRITGMRL